MAAADADRTAIDTLRSWLLTGLALTVPLVVTLVVLGIALDFLLDLVSPAVTLIRVVPGISPVVEGLLVRAVGVVVLAGFVVTLGAVADATEADRAETFHAAIERIPGIGDLYRSFRRMSDVVVDSDTETFQEVKLVEFPNRGSYSLAFVTAETPGVIQEAAGELEMQTLFVPLAPNPVMGGFLVHVAAERIHEVDITVEEAVETIVTTGISIDAAGRDRDRPLSMDELAKMGVDPQGVDVDLGGGGRGDDTERDR